MSDKCYRPASGESNVHESWCWREVSYAEPHVQSKLDGNAVNENENSVWDCRSPDGGGDPWALSPEQENLRGCV